MRRHKCAECGREFLAKRYDAKYCGATCRKRFNRDRKKAERQAREILHQVDALKATLLNKPHARTKEAFWRIEKIRDDLAYMLTSYNHLY